MGGLGYGFAEVGTVTPWRRRRPRVWRLTDDGALVNRMGFNNAGAAAVTERVLGRTVAAADFVVGVSIGRGAATADDAPEEDYLAAAKPSPRSPTTSRQRQLPEHRGPVRPPEPDRLAALVVALDAVEPRRPLVVKLSPDQPAARLRLLVDALGTTPAAGLILSNTSRSRDRLRRRSRRGPTSGLSGRC